MLQSYMYQSWDQQRWLPLFDKPIAAVQIPYKSRPLLHKFASSLHHFCKLSGLLLGCGNQLLQASRVHSMKIKTEKVSSEGSEVILQNFAPVKIFRYTANRTLHMFSVLQ